MRESFEQVIRRLSWIRNRMDEYISEKGVSTSGAETILDYVNLISSINNDIEHVRNGYQLFKNNTNIEEIPSLTPIDLFDSMYMMCYGCTSLQHVGQLETGNVTDMMWAFYGCSALDCIDGLITSKIKSTYELFHGCKSLQSIWYPLDFSNVESPITYCFISCSALKNVEFSGSINVDIAMNGSPKLTVASLTSLLAALADFSEDESGEEHLCNIGKTNLAKLTDTQKAVATDKGWTLE